MISKEISLRDFWYHEGSKLRGKKCEFRRYQPYTTGRIKDFFFGVALLQFSFVCLQHCHKFGELRDEVFCQLMKQTTNNKSQHPDSCQRGWRLFSIVAAYFTCSDHLKPYLTKYLETAAYDKRRAYHGTATVCLQNLRKTMKYGGRKNVPSVEEIMAISAGRNAKRQIYRLPGGTERVINTKCTTVVQVSTDQKLSHVMLKIFSWTTLSITHMIISSTHFNPITK